VRDLRRLPILIVCATFTGPGVAWANEAHVDWVEDPYAEHVTRGSIVRLGTSVGSIYGERLDVLALGLTLGVGQRFGRFTIEAEYSYLGFQQLGPSSLPLGAGQRLGAIARFDVIRIGPRWVGGNSLLSFFVEGGAAVAWNHWFTPTWDEASRLVPSDTKRPEATIGFGVSLDHRLQEPIGFPRRVGWFLGWRLALAPHQAEAAAVCRGTSCRPAPMMPEASYTDRSMLFQSSLAVTW
jgi:hypothetical protein